MSTKLIDHTYVTRKEFIDIYRDYNSKLQKIFNEIVPLLNKRWVMIKNKNVFYDRNLVALFPKFSLFDNHSIPNTTSEEQINVKITNHFGMGFKWEIIEWSEKIRSIQNGINFPFKGPSTGRICYRNNSNDYHSIVKVNNTIYYSDLDGDNYTIGNGTPIAIHRLNGINSKAISYQEALWLWLQNGLIPEGLKNEDIYIELMKSPLVKLHKFTQQEGIISLDIDIENQSLEEMQKLAEKIKRSKEEIIENLLKEDYVRADITEYPVKILHDINEGHWSLWEPSNKEECISIKLEEKLVARDPKSSIVEGIVGIDFGTKSTVVVYQEDSIHTRPMRIGTGDLSKKVEKKHYENPTIMDFKDIESFIKDYTSREGRPETKWEDLKISHTAFNNLKDATNSKDYNAYINNLKQWIGNKKEGLKITDKMGYQKDSRPYLEIRTGDFDPVEIYAYYIGLYINNIHNGIYMNYVLSFPVTYEMEIRKKVIESFERGLKKSLPTTLLADEDVMEDFSVTMGASEPAAYAVTALAQYGFDPEDDEKIFYGIFDFGGGTTDFDFGIWRASQGAKERRYDYAIEHFGAGGDRYLGGENLLELLAYETFKANVENGSLREDNVTFTMPEECRPFPGSEMLISKSREANLNTRNLVEALRPFWEENECLDSGIRVNLYDRGENLKPGYPIDFDSSYMAKVLKDRIKKGVDNFFSALERVMNKEEVQATDAIHIFLAGNSCKSALVKECFDEAIEKYIEESNCEIKREFFRIYPALGTEESYELMDELDIEYDRDNIEIPTGKTGVAYGLVESRKGGRILVIDKNMNEDNIKFKYYLGENKKKMFSVVIDRDTDFNKWIEYIDAAEKRFEIYYTEQPTAGLNRLSIMDESIKLKRVDIDIVNEDAMVYFRIVSPSIVEYTVALPNKIESEEYLGDIYQLQLN